MASATTSSSSATTPDFKKMPFGELLETYFPGLEICDGLVTRTFLRNLLDLARLIHPYHLEVGLVLTFDVLNYGIYRAEVLGLSLNAHCYLVDVVHVETGKRHNGYLNLHALKGPKIVFSKMPSDRIFAPFRLDFAGTPPSLIGFDPAEALDTPEEDPDEESEESDEEEYGDSLLANLLEQLYADFRRAPLHQKAGAHANLLQVIEEFLRKEHEVFALQMVNPSEKLWSSCPMDLFIERVREGRACALPPPSAGSVVDFSGAFHYWDQVFHPTGQICIRFH